MKCCFSLLVLLTFALAIGCGGEDEDPLALEERAAAAASCRVSNCYDCITGTVFTWKGACFKDSAGNQGFLWHNTGLDCDSKIPICDTSTPSSSSSAPPATLPAGVQDIQSYITHGDYSRAISETISYYRSYGLDCGTVSGGASGVYYDSSVSSDGYTAAMIRDTATGPTVALGALAFRSPAYLATTIFHETVHTRQRAEGRSYPVVWGSQGYSMKEAEAYKRSLDWAQAKLSPGLTAAEYNDLNQGFTLFYDSLSAENKARFARGEYTISTPKCGPNLICGAYTPGSTLCLQSDLSEIYCYAP